MIRRSVKRFRRTRDNWEDGTGKEFVEEVEKRTWWFLFIPLVSTERLL